MNRPTSTLAFLIVTLTCSPLFAQGEKVSLALKYLPGKTYVIEQKMTTKSQVAIPGAPAGDQNVAMTLTIVLKADQSAPDEKKVTMAFASVKMKMDVAGQNMDFDSADPSQSALFSPVLEMKPTLVLDNADQVLRMEGTERQPAGPFGKFASPEMLKQMMNGFLGSMPSEPVAVGHTWDSHIDLPLEGVGKIETTVRYHFEKMESIDGAPCAKVKFESSLEGELEAGEGAKLSFSEGKVSGFIHLDPAIGYVRRQDSSTTMVMKMTIPGQGEITIPLIQNQTVRLLEFKDSPR